MDSASVHKKARCETYPNGPKRFPIKDSQVPWAVKCDDYVPDEYTAPSVLAGPVWADPNDATGIKFNHRDGKIERRSHDSVYLIDDKTKRPMNPRGRTGITGRGLLGRYGPNHAADPIVTRWQRNDKGQVQRDSQGRPILEFIAVVRKDNGELAIPGGMVEAGEKVSLTLKREFSEETCAILDATPAEKAEILAAVDDMFKNGEEMYRGYVDDPRNTDNAWMETIAVLFHDNDGTKAGRFKLRGGDDAAAANWVAITDDMKLYASHADFIRRAQVKAWQLFENSSKKLKL